MKRKIDGIFLLNKPLGDSSNQTLQRVKRLFNAEKAGHSGSLDPLATGMLPICLGEATKFSQHLLNANKTYQVTAVLGIRTDSGDAEGQVIHHQVSEVTAQQLQHVLPQFIGLIQQIPPMYSALKYQGKCLYEYARRGETIDRPPREVMIYELEWLAVAKDSALALQSITLRVHCSKGTYIRSLIDDIGQALGCGAHVTALHRTGVEPFSAHSMLSMQALENANDRDHYLLPIDAALMAWPRRILNDVDARRLLQGLPLHIDSDLSGQASSVRFYHTAGQFLGVGTVEPNGEITHKRLLSH